MKIYGLIMHEGNITGILTGEDRLLTSVFSLEGGDEDVYSFEPLTKDEYFVDSNEGNSQERINQVMHILSEEPFKGKNAALFNTNLATYIVDIDDSSTAVRIEGGLTENVEYNSMRLTSVEDFEYLYDFEDEE